MSNRYQSAEQRFWSFVQATDSCWLWTGALNRDGYGRIRVDGKKIGPHRFIFMLAGVDPGALVVCHACDNPRCVNPEHLFLGTMTDNMRDMSQKRRNRRGEQKPSAKLTAAAVRAIRASTDSTRTAGRRFGVSSFTVSQIRRRVKWSHVE